MTVDQIIARRAPERSAKEIQRKQDRAALRALDDGEDELETEMMAAVEGELDEDDQDSGDDSEDGEEDMEAKDDGLEDGNEENWLRLGEISEGDEEEEDSVMIEPSAFENEPSAFDEEADETIDGTWTDHSGIRRRR